MTVKFTQLNESLLAPRQKIDAAITFLLPKLDFIKRGAEVALQPLNQLDRDFKRVAKKWLFLPSRASTEPVYMLPSQGGAGLLSLRDTQFILWIQGYLLLTCRNPLSHLGFSPAIHNKLGHAPSPAEVADYL